VTPPVSIRNAVAARVDAREWYAAPPGAACFAALRACALSAAACLLAAGCAAVTNPVANGLPVRLLPEELKAESREGFEQVPLTLLRQPPPDVYVLDAGDTLGVYIEGVIGSADTPPPVNLPDVGELPPSIGYPFPIRSDGTISLPYVGAVKVAGVPVEQAEQRVIDAYLDRQILRPEDQRILVTLMRPRTVRVLVVREDSQQDQISLRNESLLGLGTTETTIGGGRRSVGQILELPAYENDVLNALARTGGLPGLESTQEVVIQRGYWDPASDPDRSQAARTRSPQPAQGADRPRVTRIPLRIRPGDSLDFTPEDVILHSGDIVTVRGRDPAFFYTGGLLPAGEHPLPMDYDLRVVEAVLKSRGPLLNGGLNTSNLSGALVGAGVGNPSPNLLSVLRSTSDGGQVTIRVDLDEAVRDPRQNILVEAGDVLILQEAPDQAITRYFTQVFQANFFFRWLDRDDARGEALLVVP
jgi:protein involved in polysaccharide export with SLBB domain